MILKVTKEEQAYGAFNNGEIVENKPIGFNREGGKLKPYSNLFYWANAVANVDSTIGLHPHQGFEIMSFVLEGKIRHFDTQLKEWIDLEAGDVQIIRAGDGISHAEHMTQGSRMFQIWFDPDLNKTISQPASYNDYKEDDFTVKRENGVSQIRMVGKGAPIQMDAPLVTIEKWNVDSNFELPLSKDTTASIYVIEGTPQINGENTVVDDFVLINDENEISVQGKCNLFVILSPKTLDYKTYAQLMQRRMH